MSTADAAHAVALLNQTIRALVDAIAELTAAIREATPARGASANGTPAPTHGRPGSESPPGAWSVL